MGDTADRVMMRLAKAIEAELIAQGRRSAPINYREAVLKVLGSSGLCEAVEALESEGRYIVLAALLGEGETLKAEEQADG